MKIHEKKDNKFTTDDLYISCVLKAAGIPLIDISRNRDGKVTFLFDNAENASETIRKHWNKDLRIISLDLIEAISQLKSRIYTGI